MGKSETVGRHGCGGYGIFYSRLKKMHSDSDQFAQDPLDALDPYPSFYSMKLVDRRSFGMIAFKVYDPRNTEQGLRQDLRQVPVLRFQCAFGETASCRLALTYDHDQHTCLEDRYVAAHTQTEPEPVLEATGALPDALRALVLDLLHAPAGADPRVHDADGLVETVVGAFETVWAAQPAGPVPPALGFLRSDMALMGRPTIAFECVRRDHEACTPCAAMDAFYAAAFARARGAAVPVVSDEESDSEEDSEMEEEEGEGEEDSEMEEEEEGEEEEEEDA